MKDYIVSATAAGAQIRAFACTTGELVEECRSRHNSSPVITAALGRLLSAGAMMGSMMKGEGDKLTLKVSGNGPAGSLIVTVDSEARVKGYAANPAVLIPAKPNGKLDVSGAVGNGNLTVIRDLGLKDPYVGTVDLQTGEIAEDLTYYYAVSEQVPSAVGLGVLMTKENTVQCAGGFIVQLMPGAPDGLIEKLEDNIFYMDAVTTILAEDGPEALMQQVMKGLDLHLVEQHGVEWRCPCSRARVAAALESVGAKALYEMAADGAGADVDCQFCGKQYAFSAKALREMAERIEAGEKTEK